MPDITATVSLGNFPTNYCWPGPVQYALDLVARLLVTIPSSAVVVVGPDAPADHSVVWVRTVGGYLEGIYLFLGAWYRPHPTPPSGSERRLWVGTNDGAGLGSYDGGDGTNPDTIAATPVTGSFWIVDHNFDARIPMGPGTFGTFDSVTRAPLAVGANIGSEKVSLTVAQLAAHQHHLVNLNGGAGLVPIPTANNYLNYASGAATASTDYVMTGSNNIAVAGLSETIGTADGATAGFHENLPPVRGCFIIRRTARIYYTAS